MANRIGGINLFPNSQNPQVAEGYDPRAADVRTEEGGHGSVMTLHFRNSVMRDNFITNMCEAGAEETGRITDSGFNFHVNSVYTETGPGAPNKRVVVRAATGGEFEFQFLH